MDLTASTFIPVSAMANSDASRVFSYDSASDTLVTIKGANYFDDAASTTGGLGLTDGDVILATGTNGTSFLKMSVSAGAATVASANDFA